jgi:hypothetical protein
LIDWETGILAAVRPMLEAHGTEARRFGLRLEAIEVEPGGRGLIEGGRAHPQAIIPESPVRSRLYRQEPDGGDAF